MKTKKDKNIIHIIAIIVIIGCIASKIISYSNEGDLKTDAWITTKHEVEKTLKSPSTAKFPSMSKIYISEDEEGCTIVAYVDAENSFGAKVRSNFTAILKKKLNGKYYVDNLYID